MRGRKKTSTQQKRLSGEDKNHPGRINKNEPQPAAGAPPKPDHLDSLGSAKWDALVDLFGSMGMLNQADGDLLEAYCVNYSGYRRALERVDQTGIVLVTAKINDKTGESLKDAAGNKLVEVKRNPYSVELHKYMDRMTKLLAEMGLTPSSRTRVVAAGSEEEDPLIELMKRQSLN